MRRPLLRLAILLGSTALFVGAAELLYRQLGPAPGVGELFYADVDHVEFDLEKPADLERAQRVLEVVPDAPRFRMRFKPGVTVRICYRGYAGREPFDAHGCVTFGTNSWGVRDREELCGPKPDGQTRVVCLGDSTTVGWGVPAEDGWTRRVESELRDEDDGIRAINCGAAGTLLPDEYAHALFTQFARFEPDAVLVTLCLNDLLPVNGGMAHYAPDAFAQMGAPVNGVLGWSRITTDLVRAARQRDALRLDPAHDWVAELLALPLDEYPGPAKQLGDVFWGSGIPQGALRAMRDWCRERDVRFAVAVWPFLQQLETRRDHPFRPMHERVAAFCATEDIPFLDLLDVFVGQDARTLWVTPRDMHGNVRAHALAAPAIAEFVRELLRR